MENAICRKQQPNDLEVHKKGEKETQNWTSFSFSPTPAAWVQGEAETAQRHEMGFSFPKTAENVYIFRED